MPRMGNQFGGFRPRAGSSPIINPSSVLCPLWIAETAEALSPCGLDPPLHTSATALHMQFQCACGSRGKPGSALASALPLFQNRRIAQPGFRKLRNSSTVTFTDTLRSFPLFLVELRVLLSFSLILHPFITTRRALCAHLKHRKPPASSRQRTAAGSTERQERNILIFQRTVPVFHAQLIRGMNTIEERKYSRFRQALSCCRVWPVRKAALDQGCRDADQRI